MSVLRELLIKAVSLGASDIHLKVDQPACFRVSYSLTSSGSEVITPDAMHGLVEDMLPSHARRRYELRHEVDFSLEEAEVGRFRVNVFVSHGMPTVAMRHVKTRIPTFEELHLPAQLKDLVTTPRGIIMASGTTGCGKSTTLAALIQRINATQRRRIITIEDPIEYVFEDDQSIISQREVGLDTVSFAAALRHILRQDPDVIMIGEMRDAGSFMAATTAAETGHLVLTTLHTDNASQAITRILNFFPFNERDQIRMSLASNLKSIVCQRLIPAVHGGVVPAVEIMISTPTVRKLIEKNVLEKLSAAVETGTEDGMQTFNQAIYEMIRSGMITEEEGLPRASNPETLKMNLKGIFLDEARRILSTD
ncbi:MAG: PilT/PilU family type 4a pilus ATPase [Verrucomicrobiota bacterium]